MTSPDTIFALSSGMPPAAIAIIRISGPHAGPALASLAGDLPPARYASLRRLRDDAGELLDEALVLWFPGPATATGEDLAELHVHGGRAVIGAVQDALRRQPHLRQAEAGEFTRRAFANGRIDLAEAEGLADLLAAETELQRRHALALAQGGFSAQIQQWRAMLLRCSAMVEAQLDFGDEDDVDNSSPAFAAEIEQLAGEIDELLSRPRAEMLREGFRVVLAGPPNAGKSSLFNHLVDDEAAITAPIAGTTRDVLMRSVALDGIPFTFVDTAGLHEATSDTIEAIGMDRARRELERADLVLWLGPASKRPDRPHWIVRAFADREVHTTGAAHHRVSSTTGSGIVELRADLITLARTQMPQPGTVVINERQSDLLAIARDALVVADGFSDLLIAGEHLRIARVSFDRLLGDVTTEDMLDSLFGRFCIGK